MSQSLSNRLIAVGCMSVYVRGLASSHPKEMLSLVERMEALSKKAKSNKVLEEPFDGICVDWYLSDAEDETKALQALTADIERLEKMS